MSKISEDLRAAALRDHPQWVFVWTGGKPYTTQIIGWTRRGVMCEVAKNLGQPWNKTYRQGGRIVRISMEIKP